MNARLIEVNEYYKALHPEALILYHLPGQYAVLGDDVGRASKSIPNLQVSEPGLGLMPDTAENFSKLAEDGTEVLLIKYRNDQRELDFPDIKRLKAEQEMDY